MSNDYPDNWDEIATRIKDKADWCCERCGHLHAPDEGFTLTVHHLDGNEANNEDWNLAALCQRCHLHLQRVSLEILFYQLELVGVYEQRWLMPHKKGFMEWFLAHNLGK